MKITIWTLFVLALCICQVLSSPVILGGKRKSKGDPQTEIKSAKKSALTDEERQFLKEVEAKYNIKSGNKKKEFKKIDFKKLSTLPAVIAIEIVNDTAADGKGKRTIDANLGYGYQTNDGYAYNQLQSGGSRGRFVIYPYSQHDIPPPSREERLNYLSRTVYDKGNGEKTYVEIQPSRAYQLIPVDDDENTGYNNVHDTVSQIRNKYEHIQSVESPPPTSYGQNNDGYSQNNDGYSQNNNGYGQHNSDVSTTLYTTYNGGQLSGLSGHFPNVMQNYYVEPSQILGQPQYQQQESYIPQRRVIPVLILRIPSSQLQKPTAELYPHLPLDHGYSLTANNLHLQALVRQALQSIYQPAENQQSYYTPQNNEETYYQQSQYEPQHIEEEYGTTQQSYATQQQQYAIPQAPGKYRSSAPYTTFSQVYRQLTKNQESQEPSQDQAAENEEEQLSISENYPDSAHTNVILPTQYHRYTTPTPLYTSPSQAITFVTPSPYQDEGVSVTYRGQPTNDNTYEDTDERTSTEATKVYNYHARPYPGKRQVDSNTAESSTNTSTSTRSRTRRLRSRNVSHASRDNASNSN